MADLQAIRDEYEFLDPDDRYRLLIDLGRALVTDALVGDLLLHIIWKSFEEGGVNAGVGDVHSIAVDHDDYAFSRWRSCS